MPFRRFDGTSSKIDVSIGAADVKESARTLVSIVRMRNDAAWGAMITQHKEGTVAQADFERSLGNFLVGASPSGESVSTVTFKEADGWCLVAYTATAATEKPKMYKITLPGKVLTESEGGVLLAPPTVASSITRFGAWQTTDFLKGDYAAAAIWKKVLTKGEIEELASAATIESWLTKSPAGLWMFNQTSTGTEVKDSTAGGANQSAITGTEVIAEEPPIPYTGGPSAMQPEITGLGGMRWVQAFQVPIPPSAGATAYVKELAETITATDAIVKSFTKTTAETITATEALTKLLSRSLAETVTASEATVKNFSKPSAETLTGTDALGPKAFIKALSETLTGSDAITKASVKTLAQTITGTDALVKNIIKPLTGETITASDSLTLARFLKVVLEETITGSDSLTKQAVKALAETVTGTDAVTKTTSKGLSETLTGTDAISKAGSKALAETITASDAVIKVVKKALSDTVTGSDSVKATIIEVIGTYIRYLGAWVKIK